MKSGHDMYGGNSDTLWLSERVELSTGRTPRGGALIQFIKGPGQRYSTVVHRRDGVQVEVVAGGYNQVGGPARRIPHDLAHFVVEDALKIDYGLWGLVTAGALLDPKNTRIIGGRQKGNGARRSQQIKDWSAGRAMQVELMVRSAADLTLAGRFGDVKAFQSALQGQKPAVEIAADDLEQICTRLQEWGRQWEALEPWTTFDVVWTRPMPALA